MIATLILAIPESHFLGAQSKVRYLLLPGSVLAEECPSCDVAPTEHSLRGTFVMRLKLVDFQLSIYEIEDINWTTGDNRLTVRGSGHLRAGIGPSVCQTMGLTLEINGESEIEVFGGSCPLVVPLPALDTTVREVTSSKDRLFRLRLVAAPSTRLL